jgi:Uma2 family endonuclease
MAVTPPLEKSLVVPDDPIYRLSVAQYHDMIQSGILTDDDPVELLEGWLVTKMPKSRRHTLSTRRTRAALTEIIPAGWYVDSQEPITTADSEPEPDVVVVRGSDDDYVDRHPAPADVALVVEVADATLQRDRTLKLRIYASAGIAVYWILNLQEFQLEVYSEPTDEGEQATYARRTIYKASDRVPVVLDGVEMGQLSVQSLMV